MKNSPRCYGCVYCQMCDKENELKCASQHYIMFTTEEQAELCDLMCNNSEEENDCN